MASARRRVIPGFGLSLGLTLTWLSLIVLIPLAGLAVRSAGLGWTGYWDLLLDSRVGHAFAVTLGCSLVAALANVLIGGLTAWVLVRYAFPGRRLIDALIDLPFAMPTAVAGISLATLYGPNGCFGKYLPFKVVYTPLGIVVALVFIGLPFVVRTVQPVLADLAVEVEEAAASLGANRWQVFRRVLLPEIIPALLTGFAMALARGLGEYGSVIFIASNKPRVDEIVPLLIVIELEGNQYAKATAIGLTMLLASFALLFAINLLQRWAQTRASR
jgi:sulfate transport system permease protein